MLCPPPYEVHEAFSPSYEVHEALSPLPAPRNPLLDAVGAVADSKRSPAPRNPHRTLRYEASSMRAAMNARGPSIESASTGQARRCPKLSVQPSVSLRGTNRRESAASE